MSFPIEQPVSGGGSNSVRGGPGNKFEGQAPNATPGSAGSGAGEKVPGKVPIIPTDDLDRFG
jgi:hypothetical protein